MTLPPWEIVAYAMLVTGMLLSLWRLLRGPTLPDRVVAFDLFASLGVGIIAVYGVVNGLTVFLDVAIIVALVGFLGTVGFARYLEKGNLRE